MSQGACREADPDIFYPDDNAGRTAYARARVFCVTCPVVSKCLRLALDNMTSDRDDDEVAIGAHGMWGNTTPRDRWALLGKRWAA